MTHSHHPAPRRADGRRVLALCVATVALSACAFPTEIPQVDQRWIVPSQSTSIAIASLLPAGVAILPDSSAFTIAIAPASVTRALSADCAACAAANGTTVPKPAFVASASASTALPADIAAATLTAGSLQVVVKNNYNFDPLRPTATTFGFAIVTISNGSTIIGRDSVNGATAPLAPGASLSGFIPLAGTISSTAPLTVTVQITSPAGDPILMDASRTVVVTATPSNLRVASASVAVASRQVASSVHSDLTDIDETVVSHVLGGALLLDIVNPLAVAGNINVQFSAPGIATISRSILLATGTTHPSVSLSQAELQSLLGHDVTISFSGPVSGTAGPVTVTPRQVFAVTSRLDVTLHTGG